MKDFTEEVDASFETNTTQYANSIWRLDIWKTMIKATYTNHFIFGYDLGYEFVYTNLFSYEQKVADPHNSYIQIFLRNGIVGTILFLLIHVYVLIKFFRTKEKEEYYYMYLYFYIACILVVSLNVGLENPYIGIVYWFSLGMMRSISIIKEKEILENKLLI